MRRCAMPRCDEEGTNQHGMLWYCFDHVCQVMRNRKKIVEEHNA